MRVLLDGLGWLTTLDEWGGNRGIAVAVRQHVGYSLAALLGAVLIGLPIGLTIGHTGRGRFLAANVAGLWRAVPTVGVVTLLYSWRPLSLWPVLGALTVLAIPPVMLTAAAGIESVRVDVRDAARGMGLTGWQSLWQVEVPNAMPMIVAGVRSAANQVIATAAIAGFVGLGTLGEFIFSGFATRRFDEVAGASLLVIALVLVTEMVFAAGQRLVVPTGVRVARRR